LNLKFINELFLEQNELYLNGVFEKVLEFIDLNSQFLRITSEIKKRFDFNLICLFLKFLENNLFKIVHRFQSMTHSNKHQIMNLIF